MKIYIYAIAKNEEKFAKRFMDSVKDADKVIVCDTGSTDNTINILKENGAEVHEIQVSPFRFDLARNMALLECQDADVVIALDLDEVMCDGWREKIEKNWKLGETNMLKYRMVFGWKDKEQTIPNITVWGVKIHCPKSWIWVDPINENLLLREGFKENVINLDEHLMVHYPDTEKEERNTRIEMMKKFVKDEPNNTRSSYILGREYFNKEMYKEAEEELKRYLSISTAYLEKERYSRSSACRMIANSLIKTGGIVDEIVIWFIRSVAENPSQREPWIYLANAWDVVGDKDMAIACANRGLQITDEKQSIIKEENCWGENVERFISKIKI